MQLALFITFLGFVVKKWEQQVEQAAGNLDYGCVLTYAIVELEIEWGCKGAIKYDNGFLTLYFLSSWNVKFGLSTQRYITKISSTKLQKSINDLKSNNTKDNCDKLILTFGHFCSEIAVEM